MTSQQAGGGMEVPSGSSMITDGADEAMERDSGGMQHEAACLSRSTGEQGACQTGPETDAQLEVCLGLDPCTMRFASTTEC